MTRVKENKTVLDLIAKDLHSGCLLCPYCGAVQYRNHKCKDCKREVE